VVPTHSSTNPLEEVSDLLDHLSLQACVELTRLLPRHRGSPPDRCPENCHPFRRRIWQNALGQSGVNPCASPAGMRREFAAGSLKWSIFSFSTVSIFVS
jgi:hypothetical protein